MIAAVSIAAVSNSRHFDTKVFIILTFISSKKIYTNKEDMIEYGIEFLFRLFNEEF